MPDVISKEVRSMIMRAVGQRDTSAELAVRRLLTSLGFRYRVRNRDLPGSPDLANRAKNWVLFVNGCFWHGHKHCVKTKSGRVPRLPSSNRGYWKPKILDNRKRDARKCRELRARGFTVAVVWECQLSDPERLGLRLSNRLRRRG